MLKGLELSVPHAAQSRAASTANPFDFARRQIDDAIVFMNVTPIPRCNPCVSDARFAGQASKRIRNKPPGAPKKVAAVSGGQPPLTRRKRRLLRNRGEIDLEIERL